MTVTWLLIRITKVHDSNTVTLCYGVVQPRRTDRLHSDQVTDTFQHLLHRLPSSCASIAQVLQARLEIDVHALLTLAWRHPATLLHYQCGDDCRVLPETPQQRPHPWVLVADESLGCWVPGLAHVVRPVRPRWRWRRGRSTRLGRTGAAVVGSGLVVEALTAGGWMTRCRPVTYVATK